MSIVSTLKNTFGNVDSGVLAIDKPEVMHENKTIDTENLNDHRNRLDDMTKEYLSRPISRPWHRCKLKF